MTNVIAHWDHKPTLNGMGLRMLFQMYDYAVRAWAVDEFYMVDLTGTLPSLSPPSYVHIVSDLETALAQTSNHIVLAKDGEDVLPNEYLGDSTYVIGPDYSSIGKVNAKKYRIQMADNDMELWAVQVLAIALAKHNGS